MSTGKRHQPKTAISRAIRVAGGQTGLARALGRRQSTIWEWSRSGRVSAEDAIAIEKSTGIPAEQMSPALAEFAQMRGVGQVRAA